ncbi:M23 family metallopeptidase [Nocardiopsis sp. RV163]|uniref:M23 family metallopeptidase n=1 Tax=Nocardiopsis sp. RV163 TaxID=1661388 RepID=UPI0009E53CC1|nr:M23 family metallopeptidase [Nocardiopsis sp. RV163]
MAPSLLLTLSLALSLLSPHHPAEADWRWPVDPPVEVLRSFDPPEQRWLSGHLGVDLAAEPGREVRAAGAGRVHFAGRVAGAPLVSVAHGDLRTTYLPVESDLVRGAPIAPGDVLGTLAAAPPHCPDRPCLHWGLLRGDDYLDPLSLLGLARFRLLPVPPTASPHGLGRPRRRRTGRGADGFRAPGRPALRGRCRVRVLKTTAAGEGRGRTVSGPGGPRRDRGGAASDQARGWARR